MLSPSAASASARNHNDDGPIADTQRWLERAVIGLNLCPFAKAVHAKGQVHYAVCHATSSAGVQQALEHELRALADTPAQQRDTTLLLLPSCLRNFFDFNEFLGEGDALLKKLRLTGTLQIASFHPDFQFAGTREDDVSNCTNRSPYPTLHLLREDSIDRAVEVFPDAERIFERNIALLNELGMAGWHALGVGAHPVAGADQGEGA